ncbi:lectin subunit alpha-like [Musca vetustissima]|uniref:lectin subunit alpha-like n=1 Tax=Musca vetustissima TaxID=27455 RepID=UPI002AB6EB9F|nr:lectin subunit alpha-like [Musca vetustissima]
MQVVTVLTFCVVAVFLQTAQAVPTLQRGFQGGEFYLEVDQKYNWFEASHECARKGLRLVEVRDATKNKELLTALESYIGNPKDFWIGANDEYNTAKDLNRPFYWSSGQRVTFTNWAKGEPNNAGSNEHCVHVWSLRDGFQWNDKACTTKYGFICEKPV